jgi:diacylglycerol kinase (ATP)
VWPTSIESGWRAAPAASGSACAAQPDFVFAYSLIKEERDALTKPAVTKETGLRHFIAAASYSWAGFLRVLKEAAFRQELGFFVVSLAALALVGASAGEIIVAVLLFLGLFSMEAMNTAVEEVIDRISPEISIVGKHAKDLGSFAVTCMIAACCLYLGFVLGKHLFFGTA